MTPGVDKLSASPDADERAAIDQAKHEREQQNGGVDPQEPPKPAVAASGGANKGGWNN
jgi:hypothetical protein